MTDLTNVTPDLSPDNYQVGQTELVQQYTETTAEALSRFHNGLFLIFKSFRDVMYNEETIGLMKVSIQENLLKPLSRTFPEFADFEFEVTSKGTIIGKNDTANTILHAMVAISQAPVDLHVDSLPQHKQLAQDMDDARKVYHFEEEDEYYYDEDDEDDY